MVAAFRSTVVVRGGLFLLGLMGVMFVSSATVSALSADLNFRSPRPQNSDTGTVYHHRLRYNELGKHYAVKLDVYGIAAGTQRTLRLEGVECFTRPLVGLDVPIARLTMIGVTAGGAPRTVTEEFTSRHICGSSSQGLFRDFTLPRPAHDPNLGMHHVEVTLEYINPNNRLSTQTDPNNRNAIGFRASIVGGNTSAIKIAPKSDGNRHYSILSDNGNPTIKSSFKLPFGLPCGTPVGGGPYRVTIYDADATPLFGRLEARVYIKDTNTRVPLKNLVAGSHWSSNGSYDGTLFRVDGTAGNKVNATFEFNPVQDKKYVLEIRRLANGNTVDIGLPNGMETIYGAVPCSDYPQPRSVTVSPQASINQSDIEPGESTTGVGYATVSDFPVLENKEWPYSGVAVRNAVNIGGYRADARATSGAGPASQSGTGQNGTPKVRCANGSQFVLVTAINTCTGNGNPNHKDKADCQYGSAATCANYYWRCTTDGITLSPMNGGGRNDGYGSSAPGCPVYRYSCPTGDPWYSLEFQATYNASCTTWNCPSPSNLSFNTQPNKFACKIWRCAAVDANVALNGAGVFFDPNMDVSNMTTGASQQSLRNNGCGYRCTGADGVAGSGPRAPLDTAEYGNDKNCYYRPTFNITCRVTDGAGTRDVVDTVDGLRAQYCATSTTVTAAGAVGDYACMSTSIVSPYNTQPWPGVGAGAVPPQNWSFDVNSPDEACAPIIARPISQVLGGDVSAGASMATGPVCSASPGGSIVGWSGSRYPGSSWPSAGNRGSRTNLAAFATGNIDGFVTAHNNPAGSPNGLAFANRWSGSGDLFGGGYSRVPCIPDYFGNQPLDTVNRGSITALGGLLFAPGQTSGPYSFTGGYFDGALVQPGRKVTAYVDGNVTIRNNVLYMGRGAWTTADQIPALRLVVRGNIYVQSNVQWLEGSYIAQPRADGTGGYIYTCTADAAPLADAAVFGNCSNRPLEVRGTFTAKRVILDRSYGTAVNGNISEEFRYLPEVWQAEWPGDNSTLEMKYDSIISLPPIL